MLKPVSLFFGLCLVLFGFSSCGEKSVSKSDVVEESFVLEPGMKIELIASEPLVIDPVAFVFDEAEYLYVVEHRGYPDPAEGGIPAKKEGRIARLEDTNHDGIYDRRSEFAGDFTYPNGILFWKGGVFVTCAPDIFYLKDTTGNGVADLRMVVLTGFYDTKTAQIRMSHPTLGLDGWIYLTGGLNGGEISSPLYPDREKIQYQSGDGRFNPETLVFEVTGGKSQFGLTIDPFGRRFGCSNRHPVQHIVLEPSYLNRNPFLLFNETVNNVSPVQEKAVVFPISGAATTADFIPNLIGRSHQGTFTAASGLLYFPDASLGSNYQGNFFICESAQNLVQRQRVAAEGVSFRSEIADQGREFIASKDEWFRPVFLAQGPRGGLYIADMRRKIIDHPSYVPEEIRYDLDYQSGKDQGRIYRVGRLDQDHSSSVKHLTPEAPSSDICNFLTSDLEWQRNLAFRILLERQDTAANFRLKELAVDASLPETRTKALWLLDAFEMLDAEIIVTALVDPSAAVREQGVRLAARLPKTSNEITKKLIQLADDPDKRVRFVSGLVLGSIDDNRVVPALAHIAGQDGGDIWCRAAIMSGLNKRLTAFRAIFQSQTNHDSTTVAAVMQDLAQLVGLSSDLKTCRSLLMEIVKSEEHLGWEQSAILGLLEGLQSRSKEINSTGKSVWLNLLGAEAGQAQKAMVDRFVEHVYTISTDEKKLAVVRKTAIRLLGYLPTKESLTRLEELLTSQTNPDLQLEAVFSLIQQENRYGAGLLTSKEIWPKLTPKLRSAVVSGLMSKPLYITELLKAINLGVIAPTEIASSDRARLTGYPDSLIRERSKTAFADVESGNRMLVYEAYKDVLTQPGEINSGKEVFDRVCSVCHAYAGSGGQVGPDLTGVKNQPADVLLLHTLVPNYEVYPSYQTITLVTNSGETWSGWIQSETQNSLTIRTAAGKTESILRTNISSVENSGLSLMPEGLEQIMSKEEIRDLIAYLKSGGIAVY